MSKTLRFSRDFETSDMAAQMCMGRSGASNPGAVSSRNDFVLEFFQNWVCSVDAVLALNTVWVSVTEACVLQNDH
jgi:hypothetical protein